MTRCLSHLLIVMGCAGLTAASAATLAQAQAFQNLGFENVVLGPLGDPPQLFNMVVDVPGWTFSDIDPPQLSPHLGGYPQQYLLSEFYPGPSPPYNPREGAYALAMGAGRIGPNVDFPHGPWAEQSGVVPGSAQSIRLRAVSPFLFQFPEPDLDGPRAWHLTLDGADVPMIQLPNGDWSGDATAFAGDLTTLRIKINELYDGPWGHSILDIGGVFDSIRFSPLPYNVTPEPSSALLAACGLTTLGALRRRDYRTISRRRAR